MKKILFLLCSLLLCISLNIQAQYDADPDGRCMSYTLSEAVFQDCDNINDLTPAEIIYHAARENNVNPVLIIAKIQDEQSLITNHPANMEGALGFATGYGAYDEGAVYSWYGFFPQVIACAYQFRLYRDQYLYNFQEAYQVYTTAPNGYNNFTTNIYPVYAMYMNSLLGTNYSAYPSSSGYYNNFRNEVTLSAVQNLLNNFGGALQNEDLFLNASTLSNNASFNLTNTLSNLYWPFDNSEFLSHTGSTNYPHNWALGSGGWHVECGPECGFHFGSDYYADDWNIDGSGDCYQGFLAPLSGTVIYADYISLTSGYGRQVIIQSNIDNNYAFRIAHLDNINVTQGQFVNVGDKLGEVGTTGSSSGCHAHCVLYKNIYQNYDATTTGFQRLQNGFSLGTSGGPNTFAVPYYFDAINGPPSIMPADLYGPTLSYTPIPVQFYWNNDASITNYQLQVSTSNTSWSVDNGFTTSNVPNSVVVVNQSTGNNIDFLWDNSYINPPQYNTIYYWSVKSYNANTGLEIWSVPKVFSTVPQLIPPVLESPLMNSVNEAIPITFNWLEASGATAYRIQVSTINNWDVNNGFGPSNNSTSPTLPINLNTGYDTHFVWLPTNASPPQCNTTYYWSVKAFIPGAGAIWTAPQTFTTTNTVCPINIYISNTVATGEVDNQHAAYELIADNIIQSGGEAIYKAGNNLNIYPNFQIDTGGEFTFNIEPCTLSCPPSNKPITEELLKEIKDSLKIIKE